MNIFYLIFPQFNPILFSIGPIKLYWYGLMYFISFIFAMWLIKKRCNYSHSYWCNNEIETLLYTGFLGVFIGGRIGYIVFYNLPLFINNPTLVFKIWYGGMSFHGGLIGVIIAMLLFSYRTKRNFFQISDFIAPVIPFGLGAGRLGNFINGELWGRVAINIPWAMYFPGSKNEDIELLKLHPEWQTILDQNYVLPRHPSQLYEMFFEGVVLFIILNLFIKKPKPLGSVSSLFLICYGCFRFIIEFFREPDIQLGLFFNTMSMGQILSLPMIISGVIMLIWAYDR